MEKGLSPTAQHRRALWNTLFYSTILGGITFHAMEIGSTRYALFPTEDRFNAGALVQGEQYVPSSNGVTLYLDGGDNLDKILAKIPSAGGTVILAKTFLSPEAGYIGVFLDTEGNRLALQNPAA